MSLKTVTFAALISVAAIGAAAANTAGSGKDQLARILGVDADAYTTAQLSQLYEAKRNNDTETYNFIVAQAAGNIPASNDTSAGNVQRALALGVEPGRFTAVELSQLEVAKRNGDTEVWKFILSGANRNTPASAAAGTVSPGKAQLAASLGLNPAEYTLSELARLNADKSSN